jgi:hypothetical protein
MRDLESEHFWRWGKGKIYSNDYFNAVLSLTRDAFSIFSWTFIFNCYSWIMGRGRQFFTTEAALGNSSGQLSNRFPLMNCCRTTVPQKWIR